MHVVDLGRPHRPGRARLLGAAFSASIGYIGVSIAKLNRPNMNREHFHLAMSAYRRSLCVGQ
jgi:hypothetical protein